MIGSVANTPSGTNYTGKANGIWSLPHHIAAKSALLWAIGQTKPNPPTIGSATAISGTSVSVAFIPPVQDGGATITIYTVTSSGGQVATGASSPIVVSGLIAGTNYTFTVTATNNLGTSVSSGTSNSASPISSDPYFNSVVLLLNGDSLTDWSNTPRTITNTGPVTIDTNTKKYGTGSMYFNGTSSNLSTPVIANSAINGTEIFTIEAWLYPTAATTYHCFYSGQWAVQVYMTSGRKIEGYFSSSATSGSYIATFTSTGTLTLNQWTHVAVTRTGNNFTIFLNGVLDSTYASAGGSIGEQTSTSVGSFNSASYFFTGFIDDLRISKGLARYTANFTPPSATFITTGPTQADPYYSSVSLLLRSNGANGTTSFIDESPNPLTITNNGAVTINTSNKKYGTGSIYSDGTGTNYLTIQNGSHFAFGTGDFTIELWVYLISSKLSVLFDTRNSGDAGAIVFLTDANNKLWLYLNGATLTVSTNAISLSTWTHVAVSRYAGTVSTYINGISGFSATNNTNLTGTGGWIGAIQNVPSDTNYRINGYIDEVRVTKGVARYKSNFTPPSAAFLASNVNTASTVDPAFSAVSLLLNGDTITDSSSSPKTITNNGSVAVNTSTKKFGTGSLYFDGISSYLSIPDSTYFDFSSNTFTIECWVYQTSNSGNAIYSYILDKRGGGGTYGLLLNAGVPSLMYGAGMAESKGTTAIPLNTWTHIAVSVNSGTSQIFINGTQTYSATGLTFPVGTAPVWIGRPNTYSYYFSGYIDDLRVTKGLARYTSDFVPPAQALPTS